MRIKIKKTFLGTLTKNITLRKNSNNAISEIIATILLLSISLSLLCVVYIFVFNNATSPSTSHVSTAQLVASADETAVYLQNKGGIPLDFNTKLIITIGGQDFFIKAEDYVIDLNCDGQWNIGEQLKFDPLTLESLYGLEVTIKVINPDSNSMIMTGLVQEGATGDTPYVQTINPYDVWPHSATMKSYYNFIKAAYLPGKFWFQWKRADDPQWTKTPMLNITTPLAGYQEVTLYNLTANKNYLFEACIRYTSENITKNDSGGIKLFTTQIDAMGIWHFDETSGIKIYDSSGQYPPNDGTLSPNVKRGPQRSNATLNHSTKFLSFDGIDDYAIVPNSNTLSVTNECTIETWINRSEHCEGLVGIPAQSSISQFGFYTSGCYDPYIIPLSGTIYAVVSTNENSMGYLGTINITAAGEIVENISTSSGYVDLYNFDSSCKTPKMVQVNGSSGIVSIVYPRPGSANRLYMKTVQIFSDGRINKTTINTRLLDTNITLTPDIICINNKVYAVVYGVTTASNGILISGNISSAGIISGFNKKIIFGDVMIEPEMIKVVKSTDIYVIVYNCIGDDGGLRTVRISSTGLLSDVSYHVWFDDDDGGSPEIINIKDNIYALVYAGPVLRQTGTLKTIEILPDGSITLSRTIPPLTKTIDQLAFESLSGNFISSPKIIPIAGPNNFYGISYSIYSANTNLWGKIVTLMIQTNGVIVGISRKDVTIEPFQCSAPYFFPLTNDFYGIVYRGDVLSGIVKTIKIQNDGHIDQNPIIDMEELGSLKSYAQDEILTSDNQYVINVFRGIDAKMVVKTVKVDPVGKTVGETFIDSYIIEPGYTSTNGSYNASFTPTIIQIYNDVFAIAYSQYMTTPGIRHGKILTIQVNASGRIILIARYTFDSNCMNTPFSFVPINKTNKIYAIAYQLYSTNQGKIATIKIADNGQIFGIQDSYVFEALRCQEPCICPVTGNIYAVIYRDSQTSSTYGRIATLQIFGSNGTIKKNVMDLWQFTTSCYRPYMINVDSQVFACVYSQYTSSRFYAYVKTFVINENGVITKSFINYLEFIRRYYTNNYLVHHPEIFKIKDRVYGIISKDLSNLWYAYQYYGYITTLRIGENGDIINTKDYSMQISTNARIESYDFNIIPFVNDSYILLYGGKNNDLYQCVLHIPLVGTNQTIFSKQGSYTIQANKTTVSVTFTDSNNQQFTLSALLEDKWNYIVTTYDRTTMNLYLNNNLIGFLLLNNRQIKVTSNQLTFGPYNAGFDEVSIYAAVLTPAKILQNYNYYRPS